MGSFQAGLLLEGGHSVGEVQKVVEGTHQGGSQGSLYVLWLVRMRRVPVQVSLRNEMALLG